MTAQKEFHHALVGGLSGVSRLVEEVRDSLQAADAPLPLISKFEIAVEEMTLNALKHGGGEESGATVEIIGRADGDSFEVIIRDNANPFNPLTDAPEPQIDAALEERDIGGLGIHLVTSMMDSVEYAAQDSCNVLTLRCLRESS